MQVKLDLDQAALDAFVWAHPYAHHMKTSSWGRLLQNERTIIHYAGFYEKSLVATALIIEQKALGCKYWYIPNGPCVDYQDEVLLRNVLQALKETSKQHGVTFVRIDPNQERQEHTQSGEVAEGGYQFEHLTALLETSGYHHLGYCYGYSGNWQPRFTYLLDIDRPLEQIIAQSYKENQTYLRKNQKRAITVREGTIEELSYLEQFGIELSHKLGFEPKTKEYFKSIMASYEDRHLFLVAEANLQEAMQNLEEEIKQLSLQVETLQGKVRNQGRIKEITREINNLQEEQKEIMRWQQDEGNTLILAAGLFVHTGKKSYDLYLYSRKGLTNFRAPISLHYKAMELLQAKGVTQYDFVGISGSLDRSDSYFGLYDFKRRFGGRFIEYLGEFDLVNRPLRYRFFLTVYKWVRRIQRKIIRSRMNTRA